MSQDQELLYQVQDHVATLTLNAPERLNTISGPMLRALSERLLEADADANVRAIILTGAGKMFCAGLDLKQQTQGDGITSGSNVPRLDIRNAPPTVIHQLDTPTICALNGSAAGYGLDTALGCDIRVMSNRAKLSAAFCARGIVPESGGTWLLPKLIGWSKACEIIFTGKVLTAEESLAMGLVSYTVDNAEVLAKAQQIAQAITANAPLAVQASKRMMRMGLNEPFPEHVHHVFLQLLPLLNSNDAKEGMLAFLEKRSADFSGN